MLGSVLKLCEPLTSTDDVTELKDWLTETWVNLAMVDYPYPANFLEPLPAWPIKVRCTFVMFDNLAFFVKFVEGIIIVVICSATKSLISVGCTVCPEKETKKVFFVISSIKLQ